MHTSPDGFTSLFPYLFVKDAEQYIKFLQDGLGGEEVHRTCGDNDLILNAQIRFGDTTMMISDANDRYPVSEVSLYLYTSDVDVLMAQALASGATMVMEIADMTYGDRQGGVKDPQGIVWWLSQRIDE